jgi:hypothetical protein
MPGLALDTGKTHEAAGFHITYWQRGRGMAARSARHELARSSVARRGLRDDEMRWRFGLPGACEHW